MKKLRVYRWQEDIDKLAEIEGWAKDQKEGKKRWRKELKEVLSDDYMKDIGEVQFEEE